MEKVAYIDIEVGRGGKIMDIGAKRYDGATFHSNDHTELNAFLKECSFLCGHNIVEHDYKYLSKFLNKEFALIDTLYLSPLLFPDRPYHNLIKDDKLVSEELNNPLSDAIKAETLLNDEIAAFNSLDEKLRKIYCELLEKDSHFRGFFKYIHQASTFSFSLLPVRIQNPFEGKICDNADLDHLARNHKVELAYAFALISTNDKYSITPPWVLKNYPQVENVLHILREVKCNDPECRYCSEHLNPHKALKRWFGYDNFRTFGGEPLQENAVKAAINGDSLLTIFPTGGGKSLTFQLPALVAGETSHGLTVVISPLQALMKDQVNGLESKGISDAVYINGLLSPIERQDALERVREGRASILYIAPEQLRSATIEKVLLSRTIARFVIDEAHCFSAWGQDFRIEYMYIGDFIKQLQQKKSLTNGIPVSCFTATAKPKVISDIATYFDRKLGIHLKRFMTSAERTNLHYTVLYKETKRDKYTTLRTLLDAHQCPAIVYVSRTKLAENLADALCNDGFSALAFHGQMESTVKVSNQEKFMSNEVQIMVATSAFGMGVDKNDVGLVVHYEISDSLENYIQEAGRAGRDPKAEAECYVLFNDDDLNKHFILLNQTKLTLGEINQVWRAVKGLTEQRSTVHASALEIARRAGWEDINNVEIKVKSALAALENAGFIRRGQNFPRIFATSIIPGNYEMASNMIDSSDDFTEEEAVNSKRIIKSLISEKRRAIAGTTDAESRIDYLSDILGLEVKNVIRCVEKLRMNGILAKDTDMTAILKKQSQVPTINYFLKLESFLLEKFAEKPGFQDLKEINGLAIEQEGLARTSIKDIRTILMFWTIKGYIAKERAYQGDKFYIHFDTETKTLKEKIDLKASLYKFILSRLLEISEEKTGSEFKIAQFSLEKDLLERYNSSVLVGKIVIKDIQDALLYMAKIGAITLEGGFMVLYNKLEIERLNLDNKVRYKKEDYKNLDEFYKQRIQQIHIVGEYANMMVKDYNKALEFVSDYFNMDYQDFLKKYFNPKRQKELSRNISPKKYDAIYGSLTDSQRKVIDDHDSKFIMVPAGPGSGKTFVLVRKLASLLLMEDVKAEQLLMLTFSRAAASEFKTRLYDLIGASAKYVEVKTFHSFCFDVLGLKGSLDKARDVVAEAVRLIKANEVERSKITKSILVIDEAQDMDSNEFELVKELIDKNEDLRVIAVGDDDQNIYEFRGSNSIYMKQLGGMPGASSYNLLENFRSDVSIISFFNEFAKSINDRIKTHPIIATTYDKGLVRVIHHACSNFDKAVIDNILRSNLPGSTCILTGTNDDAAILVAALNSVGRKAHLIQSAGGFELSAIKEIRELIELINQNSTGPYISKTSFEYVKEAILKKYSNSEIYPVLDNIFSSYEKEYASKSAISQGETVGFVSDFENFIRESNLEDFESAAEDSITVSTIHKSKGRQFDNVFIAYKGESYIHDKDCRALYVALSRAKHNLYFHYSGKVLPIHMYHYCSYDKNDYPMLDTAVIQLSHKDVVLDFFKSRNDLVNLQSGTKLTLEDDYLVFSGYGNYTRRVAKLSAAGRAQVERLKSLGYNPISAKARFVVWWKYQEEGSESWKECPVLLGDIFLKLHEQQ